MGESRCVWVAASLLSIALGACGGDSAGDDDGAGVDGGVDAHGGLQLDPEFGVGGVARATSDWSTDFVLASAWAADGNILVAGSTSEGAHRREGLIARYTAAGALDTSFGRDGFALLAFHDQVVIADIEPLADGGMLVAGTSFYIIDGMNFIARVDESGALDTSFGDGGITAWDGDYNGHVALTRAVDGRLYALSSDSSRSRLRRFSAAGALDSGFGANDDHYVELSGQDARDLIPLADGRLLVLVDDNSSSYVHRVDADGQLDPTFASNGSFELDEIRSFDMALEPGGDDLLICGNASSSGSGRLLKVDEHGVPVAGFGAGGVVNVAAMDELVRVEWLASGDIVLIDAIEASFPRALLRDVHRLDSAGAPIAWDKSGIQGLRGDWISSMLVDSGGIYLAGHTSGLGADNPARVTQETIIGAINHDGTARAGFGANGVAQAGSRAAPEVLWDMTRDGEGRLVGMGMAVVSGIFVRFDGGALDTGWGKGGFSVMFPLAPLLNSLAIDEMGRISGPTFGYNLVRYLADGSPDSSFGNNGSLIWRMGNNVLIADVIIDGQQRIVVVGEAVNEGPVLARVNPDGSLDDGFGVGGIAIPPIGSYSGAAAVFEQSDGKLVISGVQALPSGTFIARLNQDGSLDASFGTGGVTVIEERVRPFRLQARNGGGVLASGYRSSCLDRRHCQLTVVALEESGELDTGFGVGGIADVEASFFTAWSGLAQLEDGRILLAGAVEQDHGEALAVWRLTQDGVLDTSFADAGRYVFPGRGRATNLVLDGDGVIVGGWHFSPESGTDAILLRFEP